MSYSTENESYVMYIRPYVLGRPIMIENRPKTSYNFEIEQNKWHHRVPWVIFYWKQPLFLASTMFWNCGPYLFDYYPLSLFMAVKMSKIFNLKVISFHTGNFSDI